MNKRNESAQEEKKEEKEGKEENEEKDKNEEKEKNEGKEEKDKEEHEDGDLLSAFNEKELTKAEADLGMEPCSPKYEQCENCTDIIDAIQKEKDALHDVHLKFDYMGPYDKNII